MRGLQLMQRLRMDGSRPWPSPQRGKGFIVDFNDHQPIISRGGMQGGGHIVNKAIGPLDHGMAHCEQQDQAGAQPDQQPFDEQAPTFHRI